MFSDPKISSAQRITEIRETIDFISPLIPAPPVVTPRYIDTVKGLTFVQLYGVIEYTIMATIAETLDQINRENIPVQNLKPHLLGMVFNSKLDSLIQQNRKKWDQRYALFEELHVNGLAVVDTNIMPTDGRNYTSSQLSSIWKTFCISEPLFNDVRFRGRLQDIVTHRVNIAHGNVAASEVGALVTVADLYARITDVSAYCSYFISVFEDYMNTRSYLK